MADDLGYFLNRAVQERTAAANALSEAARAIHLDLARRYDQSAERLALTLRAVAFIRDAA